MINPQPKQKRIKLSKKEYEELRSEIAADQNYRCFFCDAWIGVNPIIHHYVKTKGAGGDDSNYHRGGNCVACCFDCHQKEHGPKWGENNGP